MQIAHSRWSARTACILVGIVCITAGTASAVVWNAATDFSNTTPNSTGIGPNAAWSMGYGASVTPFVVPENNWGGGATAWVESGGSGDIPGIGSVFSTVGFAPPGTMIVHPEGAVAVTIKWTAPAALSPITIDITGKLWEAFHRGSGFADQATLVVKGVTVFSNFEIPETNQAGGTTLATAAGANVGMLHAVMTAGQTVELTIASKNTNELAAFELTISEFIVFIPEPAAPMALCAALLLGGIRRRRR